MRALMLSVLLLFGCSEQETSPMNVEPLTKILFFGHQSVGANILDGVREISPESLGNIHDVYVGENRDPLSKILDFERQLDQLVASGQQIDIAALKFCFVDIPNTEISEVQAIVAYVDAIERMKQKQVLVFKYCLHKPL